MANMSTRYNVQALGKDGLRFYRRCGYAWPRGEGHVEIEVVADNDADQKLPDGKSGVPTNGVKIGETDFARLNSDSQLRVAVAVDKPAPAAPPVKVRAKRQPKAKHEHAEPANEDEPKTE